MTDYGAGTIYQRKSDQRWVAAVEVPRAPGGKRSRRTFTATTRERVQELLDTYRAANPPRAVAVDSEGRRPNLTRARTIGRHTEAEWNAYCAERDWLCEYCGVRTYIFCKSGYTISDRRATKDHRTPIAAGGSDALTNLALACLKCNREKGLMDEATFRADRAAHA